MKKRICITLIIIACLSSLGIMLLFHEKTKVSQKIIDYCNMQEKMIFELDLSDYTDFYWDTVIIYKAPITKKELFEKTGIDHKEEFDLQPGMIFTKDNKCVYEEVFKTDFESPYDFIIYPFDYINAKDKINQFKKENAIFKAKKNICDGKNTYVLKPIQQQEKFESAGAVYE